MAIIPALNLRGCTRQVSDGTSSAHAALQSPSGALTFRYRFDATAERGGGGGGGGGFFYSICSRTGPVILESRLSLDAKGKMMVAAQSSPWWAGMRISSVSRSSSSSEWRHAVGERSIIPNHYNELRIGLSATAAAAGAAGAGQSDGPFYGRQITLQVRAYDEAIVFRVRLSGRTPTSPQNLWTDDDLGTETVEFNVPNRTYAYWNTYAQGTYERLPLVDLEKPCEPPLTLELADGQWASILEAAQVDFAHMTIALAGENRLVSRLDGDVRIPHVAYDLPWRLVMVASTPGQLLERNYVQLNLNPPSRIEDTSWIQPGRVMRAMNLATYPVTRVIDFATEFNIDYVELDAGWYGSEYDPRNDATKWNATLVDLPQVIAYAKSKGRKLMLYVNHIELERHLEEVLDTCQAWGVDGVKFGFVTVGPQNWTQWLHGAVAEAAKRRLVVDIHDNYRSTGFHRTYPNLLQVEGIRGDEAFPTADQSTIYPFTRFLTGPADHTYCFHSPKLRKTKAHQLALTIVNFGPLQFLFWYDWPDANFMKRIAEAELWRELPTVWDETRVLMGVPGKIASVARKHGGDWWIGTIGNSAAQEVELDFGFLDQGMTYDAAIYEDEGEDDASMVANDNNNNNNTSNTNTIVRRRSLVVDQTSKLSIALRPSGGCAMRLRQRG